MPVGVGAREPRGDLGAIDRRRHHAEAVEQHGDVEAGEMENLEDRRVAEQLLEVRRLANSRGNLHYVGATVAGRQLHHAQAVAPQIEPHGFGVDRHRPAVARQIGQVAAVQAGRHAGCLHRVGIDFIEKPLGPGLRPAIVRRPASMNS